MGEENMKAKSAFPIYKKWTFISDEKNGTWDIMRHSKMFHISKRIIIEAI